MHFFFVRSVINFTTDVLHFYKSILSLKKDLLFLFLCALIQGIKMVNNKLFEMTTKKEPFITEIINLKFIQWSYPYSFRIYIWLTWGSSLKNDHIKDFLLIWLMIHLTFSLPDFYTFTLIIYHNSTYALVSFMAKHTEGQSVVK